MKHSKYNNLIEQAKLLINPFTKGNRMEKLIDACFKLLMFTKHNDLPRPHTDEFFELTRLLDNVETAMINGGFVDNKSFKKDAAKDRRTS